MKAEIDPKVIEGVIGAVVLIAAAFLFFSTRGQGDRSGPSFKVDFSQSNQKVRSGMMPPGWHPGSVQGSGQGGQPGTEPGAQSGVQPEAGAKGP